MLIGYARVSTQDQNAQSQVDTLNLAGCQQVYIEHKTGSNRERPELARCLETLRPGDQVIVWRLDRLGRSLRDLIDLINEFESKGVSFRSLSESIDTSSSAGKLVFHVFAALAEFERSLIQERTLAGLASARARGRKGGRPRKLDEQKTKKAKAMLKDPDITVSDVANHFGVSRGTLYAAVKR